jgi:lysyl-tRNA synthetase class 1
MPIDYETGIVIDKGVKSVDKSRQTVIYVDKNGKEKEISVLDGNCKLQWKIDFGARWQCLEVDYEIYGKDHQPNEKIYRRVCEILGGKPPINFTYEMFLSENGEKISKSKGNGISVEDWLRYAPAESLALYMFQKPRTAKRLYFDVIPKAADEYIAFFDALKKEDEASRLENPAFFIDFKKNENEEININFSLLLNLASACNPENEAVLWGFILKYKPNLDRENSVLLNKMVGNAINYYNDFVKKNKKFKTPTGAEIKALQDLILILQENKNEKDSAKLQNLIFEIGKKNNYEKNIRDWFLALYQILLGQDQGPRIGSFIALFGIDNFIKLIEEKI